MATLLIAYIMLNCMYMLISIYYVTTYKWPARGRYIYEIKVLVVCNFDAMVTILMRVFFRKIYLLMVKRYILLLDKDISFGIY
jgi:predicted nuclease with RNAse H fold